MAEKERRVAQERQRVAAEREVALKVASRSFSHRYVFDVVADVFDTLNNDGFFYDPLVREIETVFAPWLLEGVGGAAQAVAEAQALVEETVGLAVRLQDEKKEAAKQEYEKIQKAKADALAAAEAQRIKEEEEAAAAAAAEAAAAEAAAAEAEAAPA
mmetsp:Transcript_8609/g.21210  ORF Transcript_8609/g.21210 Transcript_8609/m.21210 type:complete len:157 (+) Transcript_8609:3-473(+)